MIRATVAKFRELGVPPERIRYDAFGDLDRPPSHRREADRWAP
jgi:hypothetical protein